MTSVTLIDVLLVGLKGIAWFAGLILAAVALGYVLDYMRDRTPPRLASVFRWLKAAFVGFTAVAGIGLFLTICGVKP